MSYTNNFYGVGVSAPAPDKHHSMWLDAGLLALGAFGMWRMREDRLRGLERHFGIDSTLSAPVRSALREAHMNDYRPVCVPARPN